MNSKTLAAFLLTITIAFSSCQLVGDIFKAGVWTGALIIILGIALVVFVFAKLFGGKKS